MSKTILITGASAGIGAACVQVASRLNLQVIATARSQSRLQALQKKYHNIQIIVADIGTETGRNLIQQVIKQPLDYLLHNAAILDKPQVLLDLSLADFRNNIVTNVEPIIFLTQKLIPQLKSAKQTARILSVSSGAAKTAIAGATHYCVSKAAALMANQMLKQELPRHGVLVNDVFPGVVDTQMQHTLRHANAEVFPYADDFKQLKQLGKLANPLQVAEFILHIFTQTDEQIFAQSNWIFKQKYND